MTTPFTLPSAWRSSAVSGVLGCGDAVVAYSDIFQDICALSVECKARPVDVLIAAHIAVLGMFTEDQDVHTDITLPDQKGQTHRFPVRRDIPSWRLLVEHVAEHFSRLQDLPAAPEGPSPGPAEVLLVLGDDPCVGSYGLCVRLVGQRLCLRGGLETLTEERLTTVASIYRTVLEAIISNPDGDALTVRLPQAERDEVLRNWGTGETVDRGMATVGALIEAQSIRTPNASAVYVAGTTLTSSELQLRANRIAHYLIELGATPNALIGVHLRRTAQLLPVLLGVWKSGSGYLPLDPDLPAERLRRMIEGSGCGLVVTDSAHAGDLGAPAGCRIVLVDRESEAIAARPAMTPAVHDDPRRLAYVIYTSGSTGSPKGVMVEHRGLVNYLLWTVKEYAGRGTGGSAVFSSISFDLGIPSLFAPLLTGQPVHLLPEPFDIADLGDQLAEGAPYSFLKMTPGQLALLVLDLVPDEARSLAGIVIAAGDAFTEELAKRWIEAAGPGGTALGTEYGPTEITIGNSGQPIATVGGHEFIPLGAPIPNTTMYVLNARLEPAPVGVVGEVFVGGDGVARGYVNAPALTACRFLADPYGLPGARFYRTGDRARWRADGSLEFLGRVDHQIKIRGYRVEPAEVQVHLRAHPDVAEVVVLGREANGRAPSLQAFIVPVPGAAPDEERLREHLAKSLPPYMIPSQFVTVNRIPLTANGKVDGKTLQS